MTTVGRPRGITKKKQNFSLDKDLMKRLDEVSDDTGIPKSRLMEKALTEYLNKIAPSQ